jgi:biotin carboxyl carrier protein
LATNKLTQVIAEVAGTVSLVVATPGQVVKEGDVLIIIESMKMEIPVEAPSSGTLVEMRVQERDQVVEGAVIAVVRQGGVP